MTYRALRTTYGDYGHKSPGDVFEVPDYMARDMEPLEAAGVIERFRPPVNRKAFTVFENKMTRPAETPAGAPAENKVVLPTSTSKPVAPTIRKVANK